MSKYQSTGRCPYCGNTGELWAAPCPYATDEHCCGLVWQCPDCVTGGPPVYTPGDRAIEVFGPAKKGGTSWANKQQPRY